MRGFPNGIFNPWARWNTWPGLGQEFFRRRRRPPEFATGHQTGVQSLLQDTTLLPTYYLSTYLLTTYLITKYIKYAQTWPMHGHRGPWATEGLGPMGPGQQKNCASGNPPTSPLRTGFSNLVGHNSDVIRRFCAKLGRLIRVPQGVVFLYRAPKIWIAYIWARTFSWNRPPRQTSQKT